MTNPSVTALMPARFNRAVRAACKVSDPRPPECIYPRCRRGKFLCWLRLEVPLIRAAIRAWEDSGARCGD